jgi:hypothetical protein
MKTINWKLVLDKVGTVLVDRRFWLEWVFPIVFAFGFFPYITESNSEFMADQAVGWAELLVQTLVPIVSTFKLGTSWSKRAPSGLNFKEISSEVEELVAHLSDMMDKTN